MMNAPAVVAALAVGFGASLAFIRRRWKFEFARLEATLQHERYAGRLAVDFVHALSDTFSSGSNTHNVSLKIIHDSVLRTAVRGTRAMSACIFTVKDEQLEPVAMSGLFPFLDGYPPELLGETRANVLRALFRGKAYSIKNSIFSEVADKRVAVLINDFPTRNGMSFPENAPAVPRSLLAAPFYLGGKFAGIIAIANPRHSGLFTPAELHLAEILGEQFATALKMRKLFSIEAEKIRLDQELGLAGSIQKLLLPHYIPQAHSLEVATVYRPAQQIGGDLYDVFDLGGGRIAAIVADVSGHGISAALLMAICRTNFQQLARTAITAADLLRMLNRAMQTSFKRGMFITIACAFIDTQRNTLSVARGGHERPILVSNHINETNQTEIEFLNSNGLAIGISKPEVFDATITEITRSYSRGDVLIFYTDGLTEALGGDDTEEEFGSKRLESVIQENHGRPAEQINEAIIRSLKNFTNGKEPTDDLTLVTIRAI